MPTTKNTTTLNFTPEEVEEILRHHIIDHLPIDGARKRQVLNGTGNLSLDVKIKYDDDDTWSPPTPRAVFEGVTFTLEE